MIDWNTTNPNKIFRACEICLEASKKLDFALKIGNIFRKSGEFL